MYVVLDTERKAALMPHFKCEGCKARLYSASARADLGDDLCPRCGEPLEPVGALAEIVGFQSMPLETERWLDDGGVGHEAAAEAVALPPPNDDPAYRK
jgi:hypothetical protein